MEQNAGFFFWKGHLPIFSLVDLLSRWGEWSLFVVQVSAFIPILWAPLVTLVWGDPLVMPIFPPSHIVRTIISVHKGPFARTFFPLHKTPFLRVLFLVHRTSFVISIFAVQKTHFMIAILPISLLTSEILLWPLNSLLFLEGMGLITTMRY